MQVDKLKIIETLTGIGSSKKNYYVELQKKVEEVTRRNKQLEIINQIANSFNLDLPIEQIVDSLAVNLATLLPVDDLNLSVYFDGECRNFAGKPSNNRFQISRTSKCQQTEVCRYMIKNKKCLILPEEAHAVGLKLGAIGDFGSIIYVPLIVKRRVIGILDIHSKTVGAYSTADVVFLTQLAEHLSTGLNNMRLFLEVRQRELEWEDTFKAITDPIVIINTDYQITRSNEKAKLDFGLNADDIPKLKCYQLIYRRTEPCYHCPLTNQAGYADARKTYQLNHNNKEVYDQYVYPMFKKNQRLSGVFEVYKNVTRQISWQNQLMQAEKLAAIGTLAAGVAHELNSPLTAILGNAQLLMRELPPDRESHILMEDIKKCGVRCKNIIQNLLTYGRRQYCDDKLISINEIISGAVELVGNQIRNEQIELSCQLEDDLPMITGTGQQLEQVLVNLLINAKDALADNKENKKITISSGLIRRDPEDFLVIKVDDNGCGMDNAQIAEIFTPFYTTKEEGKGTGLGLMVSMGIVQNHGGTIECFSTTGKGSQFTVLLPIKKPMP